MNRSSGARAWWIVTMAVWAAGLGWAGPPAAAQSSPSEAGSEADPGNSLDDETVEDKAPPDDGTGPYAAAAFVLGVEQFSGVDNNDVDHTPGFSLWLGQRLIPMAGIEVQWEWIDEFDVDNLGRNGSRLTVETNHITVNGRLWPIAEIDSDFTRVVQPFLKGGVGFGLVRIEDRFGKLSEEATLVLRGGGGIDWMLSRRFSIVTSGEYVYPANQTRGITSSYVSASLGFQYRFESPR